MRLSGSGLAPTMSCVVCPAGKKCPFLCSSLNSAFSFTSCRMGESKLSVDFCGAKSFKLASVGSSKL